MKELNKEMLKTGNLDGILLTGKIVEYSTVKPVLSDHIQQDIF